ncbi:MAG: carboxypeptidase-like regulatory domain-containing protein, partial [Terriglobia bacterium]
MKDTLLNKSQVLTALALLMALAILLTTPNDAKTQTVTGAVTGTVVDASGAVIPNAAITLKSEGTGVSRSAMTNESGIFVFDAVQPGA